MNEASQRIHDMIENFPLGGHPELMASRVLDILAAMNERMDKIESATSRAADVASCLANGIKPD